MDRMSTSRLPPGSPEAVPVVLLLESLVAAAAACLVGERAVFALLAPSLGKEPTDGFHVSAAAIFVVVVVIILRLKSSLVESSLVLVSPSKARVLSPGLVRVLTVRPLSALTLGKEPARAFLFCVSATEG